MVVRYFNTSKRKSEVFKVKYKEPQIISDVLTDALNMAQ